MPKGKKSTASKTVAKPIKETAAEVEKKTVKSAAEKKKATAPQKAAATKSSTKKVSATTKTADKVTKTKKAAPKTTKKSTTTKTSASSTAKKTTATDNKKRTVKKTAKGKSDEVLIQSGSKEYTLAEITELCKDAYRGGTRKQVKSIKVYVKAEKNKLVAYYVVNDSVNGSVDL